MTDETGWGRRNGDACFSPDMGTSFSEFPKSVALVCTPRGSANEPFLSGYNSDNMRMRSETIGRMTALEIPEVARLPPPGGYQASRITDIN